MAEKQLVLFNYGLTGFDDFEEVVGFEGGTANQAAVHILLGEEFERVLGVAAAAIEDVGVNRHLGAEFLLDEGTDEGQHLLCLGGSGGFAGVSW